MAFNNRGGGFSGRGGGRGFGGRRDFNNGGGRSFDRPEMHSAICSNCGKTCEVPFKPTGERPVYCSDCFEQNRGGERRENRDSRPSFRRPDSQERGRSSELKEQMDSLNAKLDKIISLLSPQEASTVGDIVSEEVKAPAKKKRVSKEETPLPQE